MASAEITRMRMRLAELKNEYKDLDLRAQQDLARLRELLDPYEDPITNVRAEEAQKIFQSFFEGWKKLVDLDRKISQLKSDLGD